MIRRRASIATALAAIILYSAAAASSAIASAGQPLPGGQPGTALLRINGTPVEERELRRFLEIAIPEESQPAESRLEALAESFVNNRLLAAKARKEGIDRLPTARSRIETRLNRLWTGVIWEEAAKPSLRIEEKDLEKMIPDMQDSVSLQQLTVETRERAGELRLRALAGEDFGELISRESIGLTAHKGGMVGFVARGSSLYDAELLEEFFRMRPGELSPVVNTGIGYAVIRVVDMKPASELRREWLAANRELLVRARMQEAWRAWKDDLSRSHERSVDQEVVGAYLKARESNSPLGPLLGRTVITVDGVPIILRDLVDPSGIGVVHPEEALQGAMRRRVEEFAMAREAGRMGLRGKHPDVLLTEKILGEYLLAREYLAYRCRHITVSEQERRDYFEANRKMFVVPRAYRFSLIETRSPSRLKKIYDLLEKGIPFEEVSSRWSDSHEAGGRSHGFVEAGGIPPELAPAAKLAPGEHLRNPLRIEPAEGGGPVWVVPRLAEVREERRLSFEEADRASLENSVMAQKRERLIRNILSDLRMESRVEFSRDFTERGSIGAIQQSAHGNAR